MNQEELNREAAFSYGELCVYLRKKYGAPTAKQESGLVRHHEEEGNCLRYLGGMFSVPSLKRKDTHLLRCDILEHLLLHIKILESKQNAADFSHFLPAIFPLVRECNDFYNGSFRTPPRKLPAFQTVKADYERYLTLLFRLKDLLTVLSPNGVFSETELSLGSDGEISERTFRSLTSGN